MNLFLYKFSDGMEILREATRATMDEIAEIEREHCTVLVFNGFRDQLESLQLLRANSHSRGDGFKPGWHPGLGMEIRTNGQYQQVLREKGMIEVGNESQSRKKSASSLFTDEIIKDAINSGAEISGQEAERLKSSEFASSLDTSASE